MRDMIALKANDILFLIGAGCSADATIPTANAMVNQIETNLLVEHRAWQPFRDLYNYIKSSILYAEGIFGSFNGFPNIEKFVNVLSELEKKERNVVYPFIANWNNRLLDLAGKDFDNLKRLKELITNQLIEWIKLDNYQQKAGYYQKFYEFKKEFQFPLRIFSLNYDLCFEQTKPTDFVLESGFDEDKIWNSLRFEDNPSVSIDVYLYKLHGSITWKRDNGRGNLLKLSEHPEKEPDLIFGTDSKLQSIDPYLFFVYELRKYSLESKLIIMIGYSFSDQYVNNLIKQALEHDANRRILSVGPDKEENTKAEIARRLRIYDDRQIEILQKDARAFLENDLTLEAISKFINIEEEEVF